MILQTFFVALAVSYIGSMSPGSVNVSVMQLAIMKQMRTAFFMSIAAVFAEFVYAFITLQFHILLSSNEVVSHYFNIISSVTIILFGLLNLRSEKFSESVGKKEKRPRKKGLTQGLILGFLNPMNIAFWLVVTTHLVNLSLVKIEGISLWAYLLGISTGSFLLLMTVSTLGRKFTLIAENKLLVSRVSSLILSFMGVYFLLQAYLTT